MAPPRSRGRKPRKKVPDPKQRSISDYFGAIAPPPGQHSSPAKSLGGQCKVEQQKRQLSSNADRVESTVQRTDVGMDKRATSRNDEIKEQMKETKKKQEVIDSRSRMDVEMLVESSSTEDEAMDVDVEQEELIMTQEGLEVRSQLEALDCRRSSEQSRSVSPAKRRGEKVELGREVKRVAVEGTTPKNLSDDGRTPPGLEKQEPPESSDDDSYADLREHDRNMISASPSEGLRRSSRLTKDVVRFDPHAVVRGGTGFGSVFGGSLDNRRRESKSAVSVLKAMVRERSVRDAEEKEIEELKQDLVNGAETLAEGEAEIRDMANEEERREQQRLARLEKYAMPIPLFTNPFKIRPFTTKLLRQQPGKQLDPVQDIIIEAIKYGHRGGLALLYGTKYLDQCCRGNITTDMSNSSLMIFHLVIFDDSTAKAGVMSRDDLYETLCNMVMGKVLAPGKIRLPTLHKVMKKYGAFFGDAPVESHVQVVHDNSLEAIAKSQDEQTKSEALANATRNLKRMLHFCALRIRHGERVRFVINRHFATLTSNRATLESIEICIRILLSEFGCRLYREVGLLITALLDRVSERSWPRLRIMLAKHILSHTTRLGLHVELVTHFLPYTTKRAQFLRLDVAFLSLMQWAEGPGPNPQCKDIQGFEPSTAAKNAGIQEVSFCIADVILLLRQIPDLDKTTDDEWACRLARVIKQTLADRHILERRNEGEIGVVHQLLKKMRSCSHRMVFGVPVQDMRLALDAILISIRDLLRTSQSAQAEIFPHSRSQMTQTMLTTALT